MKSIVTSLKYLIIAAILCQFFIYSCSAGRMSSGSTRKNHHQGERQEFGIMPGSDSVPIIIEAPEIKNKPENIFSSGGKSRESNMADALLETARTYLGVPHCMGGTTYRCIDCSGFVMKVFEEYGISLPHNSQAQSQIGEIIRNRDELLKGDVVFFKESYRTSNYITHAGIYIGNNQFIHTSSGKGVTITSLDDSWWKDKFVYGTRILR